MIYIEAPEHERERVPGLFVVFCLVCGLFGSGGGGLVEGLRLSVELLLNWLLRWSAGAVALRLSA